MLSRFSMPLAQQTFGSRPLGINSQPGNVSPFQNSQQMSGQGGQRYGVNLPIGGMGQQMRPGLLSGYLDYYKNYRAPAQTPSNPGVDTVGIAYRERLAAEAAQKAIQDAERQQQGYVDITNQQPSSIYYGTPQQQSSPIPGLPPGYSYGA